MKCDAVAQCRSITHFDSARTHLLGLRLPFDRNTGESTRELAVPRRHNPPERHVTLGDAPKSTDRVENYDFAFDGTTLQFPETSGLTILGTTPDATGWNIKCRCSAAPAKPATLTVDIVDGSTTKYSDSTLVTCDQGSKLVVTDPTGTHVGSTDSSSDHPHYIVGAMTNGVRVDLLNAGGMYFSGHGMTGVNVTLSDGISTDIQLSTVDYLIGENPGQAGIRIGDTTYDPSFDVVTDLVLCVGCTGGQR